MNNTEFASKVKKVATDYKTLYVMGCFGAPLTKLNKERYCDNHAYNRQKSRTAMIKSASDKTFGFDCVGLIKAILWGWSGNEARIYGGAVYESNGVPDINADTMIRKCSGISTDFSTITVGEVVWTNGHIGVYIGNGLVVECTPSWANKVQITACNREISGYKRRNWKKHGRLPYVVYGAQNAKKSLTVGSIVRVNKGAKTYTGGKLASFVYARKHKVKEINGDRAVITFNGVVVAAMKKSDLTII